MHTGSVKSMQHFVPGLFYDGARRFGVPAPFFKRRKNVLMYIINE